MSCGVVSLHLRSGEGVRVRGVRVRVGCGSGTGERPCMGGCAAYVKFCRCALCVVLYVSLFDCISCFGVQVMSREGTLAPMS